MDNLDQFRTEYPNHSFLPHMGVFKLDRETTKCRIVFLSNLCEADNSKSSSVSHNQAIHSGPNLNQKLSSSLLQLRFDEKLLCFDICKAFNQIALNQVDANRLLFLWFRNIEKGDYSIVGYRNVRLSFGLRCSPTILMLALYKILILDTQFDDREVSELKRSIYSLSYMDNCAISTNDRFKLNWAYSQIPSIFSHYGFNLQQFVTNDSELQDKIDSYYKVETPITVKLLGVQWNRNTDTLSTKSIMLQTQAVTKRQILSSIATQFDLFGFNGPVLNRSRLFLHGLQCDKTLGWDDKLSDGLIREWQNIARQANSTPEICIDRYVGQRNGNFKLIAFCDSSRHIYGTVLYIMNMDSGRLGFILAKNRIVNKQLEGKSIPTLELQSLALATETLVDTYRELTGNSCVNPLNIVGLEIYSDSLVALSWLDSFSNKMSKMQKRSVLVLNRLKHIDKLCEYCPIKFSFISGTQNPADAITRCLSYRKLMQSNYYSGPKFLNNEFNPELSDDILSFFVPSPLNKAENNLNESQIICHSAVSTCEKSSDYLVLMNEYSSFHKVVRLYKLVLTFVRNLKLRVKEKYPIKYQYLNVGNYPFIDANKLLILQDQRNHFPEIFKYFSSEDKTSKSLPNLVGQLNVYIDRDGLLRVHGKMDRLKFNNSFNFPLLLSKESQLTTLIILDLHKILNHGGCYAVLSEMRKRFYVPHYFSVVKKTLRGCITCRRFKERTIKLNQSPYRDWRVNPPNVPFKYIFMDFIGPFTVKMNDKRIKVYLLCFTCMWSRAVNLKLSRDLTVKEFLRAFQVHCFEYGLPEYSISDLGSQLVAGSNVIRDYVKDHHTQSYFQQNGIKELKFEQFAKGQSQLGSMVEVCVKFTKRLIYGAIKKNVIDYFEFEFIIAQTVHLVNRRPIAFKEALRDSIGDDIPEAITPEMLVHGFALASVNVIPELHMDSEESWNPEDCSVSGIKKDYKQLTKIREALVKIYQDEFLANLIYQATDLKDRYKPVKHKAIKPGDIVLLKEPYTKPNDYPMGLVKKVEINDLGEVTASTILKGKTKELVRRHVSTIIPLLTIDEKEIELSESREPGLANICSDDPKKKREKRKAAIASLNKTKLILSNE